MRQSLFLAALCVVFAAGALAYKSAEDLIATSRAMTRRGEAVMEWGAVLAGLGAMDLQCRRFVAHGDRGAAQAYARQAGELRGELARIRTNAAASPLGGKQLQTLPAEIDRDVKGLDRAMALRRTLGAAAGRNELNHSDPARQALYDEIWSLTNGGHRAILNLTPRLDSSGATLIFALFIVLLAACSLIVTAYFVPFRRWERRRSEGRTQEPIAYSVAGIFRSTLDGRLLDCNAAAAKMLGYRSVEELLRVPVGMLYLAPEKAQDFFARLKADGAVQAQEIEMRRRSGKPTWVLLNAVANQALERPACIEGTMLDISERRRVGDRLQQAQKMQAIGTLAGGLAHCFNNLLTVVCGLTELLAATAGMPPQAQSRLTRIKEAADEATRLTRQLLAFSRRQVLQPRIVDLNRLVLEHAELLRPLIGENLALRISAAADPAWTLVDPGQIGQALVSLAANAKEAMPEGGHLTISTRVETIGPRNARALPQGEYVVLTVSDDGIGMDEDTRAQIFEPFFSTKRFGSGLGLATVHGIVTQSGGHIFVASQPGHGSTFEVYLRTVASQSIPAGEATSHVA